MINLSKNLIALREKNNLSQKEFADSIGVPRSTVASYENFHRIPKLNTLILIADTYGVTLDCLIRGSIKEECDYEKNTFNS